MQPFSLGSLTLSDICSRLLAQDARYQDQQNREILGWLSPLNFRGKQKEVFESRQEGTGLWVLESALFKKWVAGDIQMLFCLGIREYTATRLHSWPLCSM